MCVFGIAAEDNLKLFRDKTYYKFHDIDIDRYIIDGRTASQRCSVSYPRRTPKTWVNQSSYTHGYGLTMSPVNWYRRPVMFIKDIPPRSSVDVRLIVPRFTWRGTEFLCCC